MHIKLFLGLQKLSSLAMTKHSISLHLAIAIPVIAVNDRMASNLSLIIAHGICDEVDPLGRVTAAAAAGHSHLKSLAAAESKPSQGCQMAKFDPFLSLDCARVEEWGCDPRKGRDQILQRSVAGPKSRSPKGQIQTI